MSDTALDVDFVRAAFPAFSQPDLKGWSFFENAGGSYACGPVIEALSNYYTNNKVQPYHPFPAAQQAGAQMDRAKSRMASMLNVQGSEVHFGPSTSQNTYNLAQALADDFKDGDEMIVTNQDHEANIGSWQRLTQRGMKIKEWQVDPATGELHIADLIPLLSNKTKAVAFTHCSNIIASVNDVKQITDLVHGVGALVIVDGVSFCGHGLPDVDALGADVYLFSLYKVYGPHLGVMVMRDALNKSLPQQGHFFNKDQAGHRFTPAGPDHAQVAAVNGVIDYIEAVHAHHFTDAQSISSHKKAEQVLQLFQQHEHQTMQPLLDYIDGHSQLHLLGKNKAVQRAPTISFTSAKYAPEALAGQLAEDKIMLAGGHFYAYRLIKAMGIDTETGVCRASMVHYNNDQDVQNLIAALDKRH